MILVTGGAGYIGSHVNKLLGQRGYETVVVDNLLNGHRRFVKWGEFLFGDLSDQQMLMQSFESYPIDAVMHFSACAYVGESVRDPAKYYRNNIANTLNLLDVMRHHGVKYIIFSSSCSVYGAVQQIPVTEDHPLLPVNPYGRTKFTVEKVLMDYGHAYGMKYVNLRYFNAAGADPDAEIGEDHNPETHLIPLVLDAAIGRKENVRIFGTDYATPDGTCIRDYVHVTDLADAHVLALEYLMSGGESDSFNLGNEMGHSVREVIETAQQVTGERIAVITEVRREGDPPALVGSSRKAKDVLQWRPRFSSLSTIIETAWRWHRTIRPG